MKRIFSFLLIAILCCSFMIVPVSAMTIEGYAEIPAAKYSNAEYIIFNKVFSEDSKPSYLLIISSESSLDLDVVYEDLSSDGAFERITVNSSVPYSVELYQNRDTSWQYLLTQDNQTSYYTTMTEVLYSTVNVYDAEGDIFFQVPPTGLEVAVMKMVADKIPTTQMTIQQQMMTIVLCGVGCLALLIGLNLLVKALRRFLLQ